MPDESGGEYWGEMVARRLQELEQRVRLLEREHRLPTHLRTDFTQPAAAPSAAPGVEE